MEGVGCGGVRSPNGSILLKCEACTFLTHYNKSINCVCGGGGVMCMCAMHEEEIGDI